MMMSKFIAICLGILCLQTTAHPGDLDLSIGERELLVERGRKLKEMCNSKGRILQSNLCTVAPEVTAGPFVYPEAHYRKNIKEKSKGLPLTLKIHLIDGNTCEPVPYQALEIWHCDVNGDYSHFLSGNRRETDDSTFLRGIQFSDCEGTVTFKTIFPGWYPGRTTHIHFRTHQNVEIFKKDGKRWYTSSRVSHVGQMYFDDEICDQVSERKPYSNVDRYRTTLEEDRIYDEGFGLVDVRRKGKGYVGEVFIPFNYVSDPDMPFETRSQRRKRLRCEKRLNDA